jgi:hypothetical protein
MKSKVNDMIVDKIMGSEFGDNMKAFLLDIINWELRNINSTSMRYTREYLELAKDHSEAKKK